MTDLGKTEKAYLAGWKACLESLQDQSFDPPTKFDAAERQLAEMCFDEDFCPTEAK